MPLTADPTIAVEQLALRAGRLYSLPSVTTEVLRLTDSPKMEGRALKECIERDPAMTTKILRVVNSSLFGCSSKVADLGQAISMLGIKPLKLLVLGFSLPPALFVHIAGDALQHYWRQTLTKAVLARELAETLVGRGGDEAFIAGLLRDIGCLVLMQELGEPYVQLLGTVREKKLDLSTIEQQIIGFDHTTLSTHLLRRWSLPMAIIESIESSRNVLSPFDSEGEANTATVAVVAPSQNSGSISDFAAQLAGLSGPPLAEELPSELPVVLRLADLLSELLIDRRIDVLATVKRLCGTFPKYSPNALQKILIGAQDKIAGLAEIFSIRILDDSAACAQIIEEAHTKLSDAAADLAGENLRQRLDGDSFGIAHEQTLASLATNSELMEALKRLEAELETTDFGEGRQSQTPSRKSPGPDEHEAEQSGHEVTSRLASGMPSPIPSTGARTPEPATFDRTNLLSQLSRAVWACRDARKPLSFILVQLCLPSDRSTFRDTGEPSFYVGNLASNRLDRPSWLNELLHQVCARASVGQAVCLASGQMQWALIAPNCERKGALDLASEIITTFSRAVAVHRPGEELLAKAAVGIAAVAVIAKNFEPVKLVQAAEGSLYTARASGGGLTKSIEVY